MIILFAIVSSITDKYNLPPISIILFSIWAVLHMIGGLASINGVRIYDTILINIIGDPFFIFKYDQFMHIYCYVAIGMMCYFVMKKYVSDKTALIVSSIFIGMGVGAMNEIIELFMVVFAGAKDAVGDYYNNALDLIFNLIGAIIGSVWASKIKK